MTNNFDAKVTQYINLCTALHVQREKISKRTVKKYNKTFDTLHEYVQVLSESQDAPRIFQTLLDAEDCSVKLYAAVHCLKYGLHISQAESILTQISLGEDSFAAFDAEMALKVWRGEIPSKTL